MTEIRVLSVDSNDDSRQELRSFLTTTPGLALVDEASNARQTLQKLREKEVDVVVIALGTRDLDAIDLTRQIREAHATARVLIVTGIGTPEDIFEAMDAGADGYLLRSSLSRLLDIAVGSVRLGAVFLDPDICKHVLDAMSKPFVGNARTLPTGIMTIPLFGDDKDRLTEVAGSNCKDGVCMVDPSFLKKIRRFGATGEVKKV